MAAVPIISESSGEAAEQTLECGCCYENENLKRLTCNPSHVFCVTCIRKDSAQTSIIRCPLCRIALSIPSAGINLFGTREIVKFKFQLKFSSCRVQCICH